MPFKIGIKTEYNRENLLFSKGREIKRKSIVIDMSFDLEIDNNHSSIEEILEKILHFV